ncbi:MAG: PDZ domain-containing protein [Cuniculiplasma divulgatum]|nr:MAG: PDZ domain-containing protein [Cuniculiplasma divulgatum]
MKLQYLLEMDKPQTHFYGVTMSIDDFSEDNMLLTMPAWAPGSYEIYDFARFVRNLRAYSGSDQLDVQKKDKSTWKVNTKDIHSIKITYEVYANELSVHTSHVDSTHAFLNGTSVFLYVEGYKDQSLELVIKPFGNWKVSTGLEKLSDNRYRAVTYDILADCPIEIGEHRSLFFTVDGKEHEIVLYGRGNEDEEKLSSDVRKIVEQYAKIFGHLPYKRYVFIYHLVSEEDQSGGLEHLNSTTIDIDRFTFSPFDKYKHFLSVTSHEFFHLWNVKRIRPIELGPFNYKEENYTTMLWIAEGFTNFYGYHVLMRAGLVDQKEYFRYLAENMRYHDFLPGSRNTSASESSFDAWIKLYRPTPNNINSYISYYLKGELLGFVLDSMIIDATHGAKSLDDMYRSLMEKYNKDGKGYTEKDIITTLKDVTGRDFSEFFAKYVREPGKLEFQDYLKPFGYSLRKGYRKVDGVEPSNKAYLGIIVRTNGGRYVVDSVVEGSPAYEAGINPKDEILAVDNFRFTDVFLKEMKEEVKRLKVDNLAAFHPGQNVTVTFFRRGLIYTVPVKLSDAPYEYYEITESEQIPAGSETLRGKFLTG